MANRNTLSVNKIDEFKSWLEKDGWQLQDTKGFYEMYETKNKGGCGKVVGRMEIIGNTKIRLNEIDKCHIDMGCVPYEFLVDYAKCKEYLYANFIGKVGKYDTSKELSEFTHTVKEGTWFHKEPLTRPPQFYCRID